MSTEGSRKLRKRVQQHEAHIAILDTLQYNSAYNESFLSGTNHGKPRIHCSQLPPAPENEKELEKHQYRDQFKVAEQIEMAELQRTATYQNVPNSEAHDTLIPTRFIHKMKFDEEGYLVKFKACLVVRGDL